MGFLLSDFTNKGEFIRKINGTGEITGYVLMTNGETSYWANASGGSAGTLDTTSTSTLTTSSSESLSGNIQLHVVSKTGSYSDLIGTPSITGKNSERSIKGYFAGKISVDSTNYTFIVSPARIVSDEKYSYQGVVRPYAELNYENISTTTFDSGISRAITAAVTVCPSFTIGKSDVVLVPITCVYHFNNTTESYESVPYFAMPWTTYEALELSDMYGIPSAITIK